MTARMTRRCGTLPGVAALVLAALTVPAMAQSSLDDGKGSLLDTLRGAASFGIGLGAEEKPQIEYRDRAPLVLPPKGAAGQLVPPRQRQRSAAWPNDPDVARRSAASARARSPLGRGDPESGREPSAAELRANRGVGSPALQARREPGCRTYDGTTCVWMNPDRLQSIGIVSETKPARKVGEEPGREWLTQPPGGYRRVTQAAGPGRITPRNSDLEDAQEASPYSFFRNPFKNSDDDE